jgi:hypothetical protein
LSDLPERFRAAAASAESIFWREPSTPAAMFADLAAFTEERGIVPSGLWRDSVVPGWVETELTCYESAISHDPVEVAGLMAEAVGEKPLGT